MHHHSLITGTYDPTLVVLSVIIAIVAAYAALDFGGRVRASHGYGRAAWVFGGAMAMGLGIWSMHYVGMLAFMLPMDVYYDVPTVLMSLLAAIASSGVALFVSGREEMGVRQACFGSVLIGSGIASMHYIGMAAMRLQSVITYDPVLWTLSIALAIGISFVALWLTFHFRHENQYFTVRKVGSALLMGLAIPAMHYTGMAAARFSPSASAPDISDAVQVSLLATVAIVAITFAVIASALLASGLTKRFSMHALALASVEARYSMLFASTPLPIIVLDLASDQVLAANPAAIRTYGYDEAEFLQLTIQKFWPGNELRLLLDAPPFASKPRICTHISRQGTLMQMDVVLRPMEWEGHEAAVLVAQDVTARIQTEEALRQSELKYRRLFEEAKDAVLIFRPEDEIILEANPAACDTYGLPREQLLGSSLKFFTRDVSAGEGRIRELLAHGSDFDYDTVHLRSDGEEINILANARVIDYAGEKCILAFMRNVTQTKRSERWKRDSRDFLELVAKNRGLETTLRQLLESVQRQLPDATCTVVQLTESQRCHVIATTLPKTSLAFIEGQTLSSKEAHWSRVLGNGNGSLVVLQREQMEGVSHLQHLAQAEGIQTCWMIRINSASASAVGFLEVHFRAPRTPSRQDSDCLDIAAGLAAIAFEHRQLTDELAYRAQHDALTGLANRILFEDRLKQSIAYAARRNTCVAVMLLDLDGFKYINDTLGHHAGDQVLMEVAQRLQATVRATDTVARIGGDEFLVALTDLRGVSEAKEIAEKCLRALNRPVVLSGREYPIGVSMGLSMYPADGVAPEVLQQNADSAMYLAKASGKNMIQVFTPDIADRTRNRVEMMRDLRDGLKNNELVAYYQAQFNNGKLRGFEALLRWQHPRLGLLGPDAFIELAEESGLIVPMGEWILRQACLQMIEWRRRGFLDLVVAVNVSTRQFEREDWVNTVARVLKETGLPAQCLELELTETLVLNSTEKASRHLKQLRELGVGTAIDDFGTGYSSLNYLRRLSIDVLKIDRSFIQDLGLDQHSSRNAKAIIRTIISLAEGLSMDIIAEGVETEDQLEFLRSQGCETMQGFLFAKPVPAENCTRLLLDSMQSPASAEPFRSCEPQGQPQLLQSSL